MTPTKTEALLKVLRETKKKYGDGTVQTLVNQTYEYVKTGVIPLELILGHPGLVRRKFIEFYGAPSSGKSLLACVVAAQVIKDGGRVLYLDWEDSLDESFVKKLGVELGVNFLVVQPTTLQQGFSIALPLLETGAIDLVVFDSVGAMIPESRLKRDVGDSTPGDLARPLSVALGQLWAARNKANCVYLVLNHIRAANFGGYGPTETTAGGNALKFFLHQKVRLIRTKYITSDGKKVGQTVKLRCEKNKLAPAHMESTFNIMYGLGFDSGSTLLDELTSLALAEIGPTGWIKIPDLGVTIRGAKNLSAKFRDEKDLEDAAKALIESKRRSLEELESQSSPTQFDEGLNIEHVDFDDV